MSTTDFDRNRERIAGRLCAGVPEARRGPRRACRPVAEKKPRAGGAPGAKTRRSMAVVGLALLVGCGSPPRRSAPVGPTCDDGVPDADESDTDCGGACAPCANGAACRLPADCASATCTDGTCAPAPACTPETDATMCRRLGLDCGPVAASDNCGSRRTPDCGRCEAPRTCGGGGTTNVCGTAACVRRTCSQVGAGCGAPDDGCGGHLACGPCPAGQTCGVGGPYSCGSGPCQPETDRQFCARLGKDCGPVADFDNCDASRQVASCGPCTGGTCGAVRPGECCLPSCEGRQCGDDGCAGQCGAGTCPTPPAPACATPTTRRLCAATGTCSPAGRCEYAAEADLACPGPDGCRSGQCVVDLEWAAWNVPSPAPASSAYRADPLTVVSDATKLVWQKAVPAQKLAWAGAKTYCEGLSLDGRAGWRLPTAVELQSIVHYGRINPSIAVGAFPDTPWEEFWTATKKSSSASQAWYVSFVSGWVAPDRVAAAKRVRCVRSLLADASGTNVSPRFVVAADTVYDRLTNLAWQRALASSGQAAGVSSYCSNLVLAGLSDWHAPNVKELFTLVDVRMPTQHVDAAAFPGTTNQAWSSTANPHDAAYAYEVDFMQGVAMSSLTQLGAAFRCVRWGPP